MSIAHPVFATIDPARIVPSPTNPRKTFPQESLAELAESLKTTGQIQPVVVRNLPGSRLEETFRAREEGAPLPDFELVVGERRWRAAKLAGLQLRCEIRALSDLDVVQMQIIENLHREDVHPLEEAEGYDYLLHHSQEDVSVDQLATRVGKSRSYVFQRVKLTALCETARQRFLRGEFDASVALLVARLPNDVVQEKAVEEIERMSAHGSKPSFRAIRDMLAVRYHLRLADAPFDITDDSLVSGCGNCIACPKRTGNQPELFQDVDDADVCIDPDCFQDKRRASIARTLAKAKADGLTVITGEDAKKLMPSKYSQPAGMVNVNQSAYRNEAGEIVTIWDLIERAGRKAPKPQYFVNPHLEDATPDQLISQEAAQALLKKFAPKSKATKSAPERSPEQIVREAERMRQHRAHRVDLLMRGELVKAMRKCTDQPLTHDDIILMICALAYDCLPDIAEHAGVDIDLRGQGYDSEAATTLILGGLRAMPTEKLAGVAMKTTLDMIAGTPLDALVSAAMSHGIDVAAIRREAKAEIAVEDGETPDDDEDDNADQDDAGDDDQRGHEGSIVTPEEAWPFPGDPAYAVAA